MKRTLIVILGLLITFTMFFSACGTKATVEEATEVVTEETAAQSEVVAVAEQSTDTPTEAVEMEVTEPESVASLAGGSLTHAVTLEPDTLDPQKTINSASSLVMAYIYSSLITKDPQGNYVPYLASSWDVSDDGLTYTFHLRNDVKFHNGDPLTAQDVVWTYQRAMDPEIASPVTGGDFAAVTSITAPDDYTVEVILSAPNYYFLEALTSDSYEGILSQSAVEAAGDEYGRNPVGTGPYMFEEWATGDSITLVRNPDFVWGPSYTNGTAPNIETIKIRFIPEVATIIAGLEAGEIDFVGSNVVSTLDVNNLDATGNFDIVWLPAQGLMPYITLNVSKPPFDDVLVRRALNYATDKQSIMDILAPNTGSVIQNGPLTAGQEGYWSGETNAGYTYDLEKAKQLMQEAGYTYNSEGMLEKDGEPFGFEILLINGFDSLNKSAEILQSQWKELGVDVVLTQMDAGIAIANTASGDYAASVMGFGSTNSDMLTRLFHSKNIGVSNMSQLSNPDLDALLDTMGTTADTETHLQAAEDAQKMILEQAYIVTLYSSPISNIVSKRITGYVDSIFTGFRVWDTYIQQ